jgi:hypothetical protein
LLAEIVLKKHFRGEAISKEAKGGVDVLVLVPKHSESPQVQTTTELTKIRPTIC